jgi:Tfp pilus assembly protein PilZ
MDNQEFLTVVGNSFKKFLETGSRSNEKLKILHGAIAKDLKERLGVGYSVCSLGIGDGKEEKLDGRYIDKVVDITIKHRQKSVAGIGVKFVMQNYSQNSNNYFENMLGETANIRCANIPYFQIFIIPEKLPYYNKQGLIQKWEEFTIHNATKYLTLSEDNIQTSIHTPTKTLLFVIHLPEINQPIVDKTDYVHFYESKTDFIVSESNTQYGDFSSAVIYNDYEDFIDKVVHYIHFI